MPQKNSIKIYIQDGYYHLYNRGVERRDIFRDTEDYKVFLRFLKDALLPPPDRTILMKSFTLKGATFKGIPRRNKNFFGQIELLAYSLMPNHFHLLVHQIVPRVIDQFIRSICTRYSMYFNKKYKRNGTLFQGIYKASLITEDPYLLHLSRYIHRNPLKYTEDLRNAYSSYGEYLGIRKTEWIKPALILSFFQPGKLPFLKHINSYQKFVEYENKKETLFEWYLDGSITLEDDDE